MTWIRRVLTSRLDLVECCWILDLGPKDDASLRLETLSDIARNRSQRRTFCETCGRERENLKDNVATRP